MLKASKTVCQIRGMITSAMTLSDCLQSSEDGGGPSLLRDPAVVRALKHDIDQMQTCRPKHPITLQAHSMLQQYLWKDANTHLEEGYSTALWLYTDPATAMQHVLHCMYIELMVSLLHL